MIQTHVILDGLQDHHHARQLSIRWIKAGFHNQVDLGGQSAWLANHQKPDEPLTEAQLQEAAIIARPFGLELRDRAGESFIAENKLDSLREQMIYEYRLRTAQAMVFGLPVLVLHYMAPFLAGQPEQARAMTFPWVIEMLLVGWLCFTAAWPIIWQGTLALLHGRLTADAVTTLLIGAAFGPSAVGLLAMTFVEEPWFAAPGHGVGPMFHVVVYIISLATFARWRFYIHAKKLAGRADLMVRHIDKWWACILLIAIVATLLTWNWAIGLGVVLLWPSLLASAGINRNSPSMLIAWPMIGFTAVYLFGPKLMHLDITHVQVELAACFGAMMIGLINSHWRNFIEAPSCTTAD